MNDLLTEYLNKTIDIYEKFTIYVDWYDYNGHICEVRYTINWTDLGTESERTDSINIWSIIEFMHKNK